jgi:hypothetical protein
MAVDGRPRSRSKKSARTHVAFSLIKRSRAIRTRSGLANFSPCWRFERMTYRRSTTRTSTRSISSASGAAISCSSRRSPLPNLNTVGGRKVARVRIPPRRCSKKLVRRECCDDGSEQITPEEPLAGDTCAARVRAANGRAVAASDTARELRLPPRSWPPCQCRDRRRTGPCPHRGRARSAGSSCRRAARRRPRCRRACRCRSRRWDWC